MIAIVLSGCVIRVDTRMLDNTVSRPKICAAAVRVFGAPSEVDAAYVEVARLSVDAHRFQDWAPTQEQIAIAQRKKAATLGANGLIFTNSVGSYAQYLDAVAIYIAGDTTYTATMCAHGAGN